MARNFISISSLMKYEYSMNFSHGLVNITYGRSKIRSCSVHNGLFQLNMSVANDSCYIGNSISPMTWHDRLRYIGQERMNKLATSGLIESLSNVSLPSCQSCLMGKAARKPSW